MQNIFRFWKKIKNVVIQYHHPNEHTQDEKDMILKRYPRYKDDMIMLWDSLRKDGYSHSYTSLVRVIRKWIKPEIKKEKYKQIMDQSLQMPMQIE